MLYQHYFSVQKSSLNVSLMLHLTVTLPISATKWAFLTGPTLFKKIRDTQICPKKDYMYNNFLGALLKMCCLFYVSLRSLFFADINVVLLSYRYIFSLRRQILKMYFWDVYSNFELEQILFLKMECCFFRCLQGPRRY